jgi:predicted RNase H-like nuclease (RuvC/YqgF family)
MKIADFEKLKEKIEESKARRSRAEGALEQAMERLKKEFGCSTIEEAEAKIETLNAELDNDEAELSALLDKIEKAVDWKSL